MNANISCIFLIVIAFLLIIKIKKEGLQDCNTCHDNYLKCIKSNEGNLINLERCANVLCSQDCYGCNRGVVKCDRDPVSCNNWIQIPQDCLESDPDSVYFDPIMCPKDLAKSCAQLPQNDDSPCTKLCDQINPIPVSGPKPCQESFITEHGSLPSFDYPSYIPQPPGNAGWGYRDPVATFKTLLFEQNQPWMLMQKPKEEMYGYHSHMVDSYPVAKKLNYFFDRPSIPKVIPRKQATAYYASW